MTPISLALWRDIARQDRHRAERLWREGMAIAATAEETGAALAAVEAADLSGRLMERLGAALPKGPGEAVLSGPLLLAARMRPGWTLRSRPADTRDALADVGAALALVALARGLAGLPPCPVELSYHPDSGVALALG